MNKYNTKNDIVYACKYNVVWCSKYRRKVLIGNVETRLKELIKDVCSQKNIDIIQIDIQPNYVNLILQVDPQMEVHKAVKTIKAYTSSKLRKEFTELTTKLPTLWTNVYLVTTVGNLIGTEIEDFFNQQKTSQRY